MKKIIAGGGLVFNEFGALLMIFRDGKWDLPKGHWDEGETIEECALREVQEETGLQQVELKEEAGVTSHTYEQNDLTIVKETHWFKMFAKSNQFFTPQTKEKITEVKWISREELPEYLTATYENIAYIINKNL